MNHLQKKDYLTGRALRLADEVGDFSSMLFWLKKYRHLDELEEKVKELEDKAIVYPTEEDKNYLEGKVFT